MNPKTHYAGFNQDTHGITTLGRVVLDAWVFGLIPREEDCAGWDMQRLQKLMDQVNQRWDEYGNLPSRLPSELLEAHTKIYEWAMQRGRERGWNPDLGDDE